MNTSVHMTSPYIIMSAYAQPQTFSPTHSSLHFPLSSPPLHIPPSLQSLETPSSNGFIYARRGRTRQSDASTATSFDDSRRGSTSSMESLPVTRRTSQPAQEYKVSSLRSIQVSCLFLASGQPRSSETTLYPRPSTIKPFIAPPITVNVRTGARSTSRPSTIANKLCINDRFNVFFADRDPSVHVARFFRCRFRGRRRPRRHCVPGAIHQAIQAFFCTTSNLFCTGTAQTSRIDSSRYAHPTETTPATNHQTIKELHLVTRDSGPDSLARPRHSVARKTSGDSTQGYSASNVRSARTIHRRRSQDPQLYLGESEAISQYQHPRTSSTIPGITSLVARVFAVAFFVHVVPVLAALPRWDVARKFGG